MELCSPWSYSSESVQLLISVTISMKDKNEHFLAQQPNRYIEKARQNLTLHDHFIRSLFIVHKNLVMC